MWLARRREPVKESFELRTIFSFDDSLSDSILFRRGPLIIEFGELAAVLAGPRIFQFWAQVRDLMEASHWASRGVSSVTPRLIASTAKLIDALLLTNQAPNMDLRNFFTELKRCALRLAD